MSVWDTSVLIVLVSLPLTLAKPRFIRQADNGCSLQPDADNPSRYFHNDLFGATYHRKCPDGLIFNQELCTCDFPGKTCDGFSQSPKGPNFYRVIDNGEWRDMPCPPGTMYNSDNCICDNRDAVDDPYGYSAVASEQIRGIGTQFSFFPDSLNG